MERPPENKERNQLVTRDLAGPEQLREVPHVHPAVDIVDGKEELIVRADMPGIAPDAIDARFQNGILILSGKARETKVDHGEDLFREFVRADYYREFAVGEGIDPDKITAEYDAGVLTLRLPKAESSKPKRIPIRRKPDQENPA